MVDICELLRKQLNIEEHLKKINEDSNLSYMYNDLVCYIFELNKIIKFVNDELLFISSL